MATPANLFSLSARAQLIVAVLCLLMLAGLTDLAFAQGSPFGVGRPPAAAAPPPLADGIVGWLFAKQAEFYRQFSSLIKAAKADGTAAWTLLGVAFLYGIFHAAGPGHGKAVISSYLVANDETWRRGLVLAFASAFLQALVAVALVGIAAALLGATRKVMDSAVWWIEVASYGLIVLIGARLIWSKGGAFLAALRATSRPAPVGAAVTASHHAHDHHHGHAHAHSRAHDDHGHEHHHHAAGEPHDEHCGHMHAPEPQMLAGPGGWQRGLSAVFAVGLRPCSGAILVLVFALAQGLFWAGVAATFMMGLGTALTVAAIATLAVGAKGLAARFASTRPGFGSIAIRGVELAAAVLVLAFGVLLLAGYMASERMSV